MSETPLYEVKDLWKIYTNGTKEVQVLKGVDMSVRAGESIAVTGPSGVGKSTLLHILGLLDRPSKGELIMDGRRIGDLSSSDRSRARNKRIGFVFQFFQLLPEFSAVENVMMPGLIAGESPAALRKKSLELLEEVGLSHRITHRPGRLSGGEQQRVAVARALIMNPDVLLADEPTGNLDPTTGEEIEELIRNMNRRRRTTLIIVTHKDSLARAMERRVGLVEGKLKELS
jgi:lipoprotein-releasing system ATP-binding protein